MTGSRPHITVIGSFAVGLTIRAPHFPVAGETLRGSDFDLGPGGKGSNQAIAAARLGAQSHLVGKIGKDLFAKMALDLYHQENVGIEFLFQTGDRATGVGFITLNAAGENHIILDLGANELLSPEDINAAEPLIAKSQIVMTVLEINLDTAYRAMELGRQHGAITIMNPAPAAKLDPSVFGYIDVLTPNESELRILSGLSPNDETDTLSLARQLLNQGIKNIVVTRGEQGALVLDVNGNIEMIPSVRVPVVDSTGAGDAFNAALAVALSEKRPLLKAVRFATYAGALACTRLGVVPSLPSKGEINSFITNSGQSET